MQNPNYNGQGSNYNPPSNYGPPQGAGQPNQMSNYQQPPPYGPPQQYGQQPPYGQPPQGQQSQYGQMPPYGQPPYNQQGMPNQPSYGPPPYGPGPQQDPNQTDIPSFRLISRGRGIDQKEYYDITHAANEALRLKEDPLSNGIIKRIKNSLGGEWMAFASVEGLKGYDFSLSIVTGNDFLSFTIENFRFQVCRLRD
jgi:hypothetical protein